MLPGTDAGGKWGGWAERLVWRLGCTRQSTYSVSKAVPYVATKKSTSPGSLVASNVPQLLKKSQSKKKRNAHGEHEQVNSH